MSITYWTKTQLLTIALLAVVTMMFLLLGAGINFITGISQPQAIIKHIIMGLMFPFIPLLIRKYGSVTLYALITALLILPIPLLEPPGFLPKFILGVTYGIIAEIIYLILHRYERLAAMAIGAVMVTLWVPLEIVSLTMFEGSLLVLVIKPYLSFEYILVALVVGSVLGFMSWLIYNKIRSTPLVIRIQKS